MGHADWAKNAYNRLMRLMPHLEVEGGGSARFLLGQVSPQMLAHRRVTEEPLVSVMCVCDYNVMCENAKRTQNTSSHYRRPFLQTPEHRHGGLVP